MIKDFFLKKLRKDNYEEFFEELSWMFSYVKKYKLFILRYGFFALLSTTLGVAGTILSKKMIDTVTGNDTSSIALVAILYVIFGLSNILLSAVSNRLSTLYSTTVTNDIRLDMYNRVLSVDFQSLMDFHSGDILNRINGDVVSVSGCVLTWLPNLAVRVFQFVASFVIIMCYDPIMALIALISSPIAILLSRQLMSKFRKVSRETKIVSSRLMAFMEETFRNSQTIKAFGIVEDFGMKFRAVQSDFLSITMKQNKMSVSITMLMSFIGMIVSYACYGWGVYRLWSGAITFGVMALFLQLAGMLSSSFSSLISMIPAIISSTTAARRLIEISNLPSEAKDESITSDELIKNADKYGISIDVDNVSFSYKDSPTVFENVNFSVKNGEIIAFVGLSGAGKTTVLRMLLGLITPTSGSVSVSIGSKDGNSDNYVINSSTRGLFSYVPQGPALFSGTVSENLRLVSPHATDDEIIDALKTACAYEFISELENGINENIGDGGTGLSEGQAQRISIARAILSKAPVLLLDEATSALDIETEKQLLENIRMHLKNKTCIVSTHRLSVLKLCEKTYKIDNGIVSKI